MFYLHVVHEAAPYARRCDLGRVHLVSSIIAPFFNPNFALRLSRPAPARHIGLVIIILSMLPDLRTACALQMQWA
jgi:hypothetical protein